MHFIPRSLVAVCAILAAAAPLPAQSHYVPPATLADSTAMVQRGYARIFAGIPLSPARERTAKRVMMDTFVAILKMEQARAPADLRALKALYDHEDSVLVSLVATPRERRFVRQRVRLAWPPSIRSSAMEPPDSDSPMARAGIRAC